MFLFIGMHSKSRSTLEVPIFWFIHSDPLFIDKYYQAKALDDMVIVAQSNLPSWESHLQCNGQSLLWDLRLVKIYLKIRRLFYYFIFTYENHVLMSLYFLLLLITLTFLMIDSAF